MHLQRSFIFGLTVMLAALPSAAIAQSRLSSLSTEASTCSSATSRESSRPEYSPAAPTLREADSLRASGDLDLAKAKYEQAIREDSNLADAYYGLGLVLARMVDREQRRTGVAQNGIAQQAAQAYRRAIDLAPTSEMYMSLGRISRYLNQPEESRYAFICANALNPLLGSVMESPETASARDLIETGRWLREQELYEEALELYTLVIDGSQADRKENLLDAYNGRGVTFTAMGRVNDAVQDYEQAISIAPTPTPYINLINQLRHSGRRDRLAEVYEELEAFLSQQLNSVEQFPEREYGNVNVVDFFLNRATFLSENQNYYALYIDLLMDWHNDEPTAGFDKLALQVSERARARSLLEILTASNIEEHQNEIVPSELIRREHTLQEEIAELNAQLQQSHQALQQLTASDPDESLEAQRQSLLDQIDSIEVALASLTAQRDRVLEDIRAIAPDYAKVLEPPVLSIEEMQALLPQDGEEETLVLQYWLGRQRSYLWVISRDRIYSYELPDRETIEQLALRLHANFQGANLATDRLVIDTAVDLSRVLLGPLTRDLDTQRLIIVADGALNYVPFAALPSPGRVHSDDNQSRQWPEPLILNHQVVNLPSLSALRVILQDADTPPQDIKLAVIADPVLSSSDDRFVEADSELNLGNEVDSVPSVSQPPSIRGVTTRLPWAIEEAERIMAEAEDADLEILGWLNFEANRGNVLSGLLNNYQIIHFATHGVLNDQDPTHSGLELSRFTDTRQPQEGLLSFADIFGLQLNAELIVLSACDTGLGQLLKGEGLIGLTQAFMYAGAESVIVSLWSVDDQATRNLMVHFYEKLLDEGETPLEALRRAQIDRFNETENGNPYYWAAFTLQGRWDQRFERN